MLNPPASEHLVPPPAEKLFVYGTLMPGRSAWGSHCEGRVMAAMPARIRGRLFDLPAGYPACGEGEGWVDGFLLYFDDPGALAAIDRFEGYDPEGPAGGNLYFRRRVAVFDPPGEPFDAAWAYFMSPERLGAEGARPWPGGLWSPGRT